MFNNFVSEQMAPPNTFSLAHGGFKIPDMTPEEKAAFGDSDLKTESILAKNKESLAESK